MPDDTATTTIGPLRPQDRERWAELWTSYLEFYKTSLPPERFDITWDRMMRGDGLFGLGAWRDGALIGITHYLFHASTWMDEVCYLQDLFVDQTVRGSGAGRALIEAVAEAAKARGSQRLYWQTQETNTVARQLYDRLAVNRGFTRYDYPMD